MRDYFAVASLLDKTKVVAFEYFAKKSIPEEQLDDEIWKTLPRSWLSIGRNWRDEAYVLKTVLVASSSGISIEDFYEFHHKTRGLRLENDSCSSLRSFVLTRN